MQDLLKIWNISLDEYEKGSWGASAGLKFTPQSSAAMRFKIENQTNEKGDIFYDEEACFREIAINIITIIKVNKPILNSINPSSKDVKTKENILRDSTIEDLKKAIYSGIMHMCENKEAWEMTLQNSLSTPNFNVGSSPTPWVIFSNMLGKIAWAHLENSDIDSYQINEKTGEVTYEGSLKKEYFILYHEEFTNPLITKLANINVSGKSSTTILKNFKHYLASKNYVDNLIKDVNNNKLTRETYLNHILEYDSLKSIVKGKRDSNFKITNYYIDPNAGISESKLSQTLKNKLANIATNKKAIDNIKVPKAQDPTAKINDWHKPLKMERVGVYKDLGTPSNAELKAQEAGGNNSEYLMLRDIIEKAPFHLINTRKRVGLIEGNYLVDKLIKGENLSDDFKHLKGYNIISINAAALKGYYAICVYKDKDNIWAINYNSKTQNFGTWLNVKSLFTSKQVEQVIDWIKETPILTHSTPTFINNEYKDLGEAFEHKKHITGDLQDNNTLFTAFIKKDTNEGVVNAANHLNVLEYNLDTLNNDTPLLIEKVDNKLKITIAFTKSDSFKGGFYYFSMRLLKSDNTPFNIQFTDQNIEFEGLWDYITYGTAPKAIGYKTKETDNKQNFLRGNGKTARVDLYFANNGNTWDLLRQTTIFNDDPTGNGEEHKYRRGQIKTKDNTNIAKGTFSFFITFDQNKDTNILKDSHFILTQIKGPGE